MYGIRVPAGKRSLVVVVGCRVTHLRERESWYEDLGMRELLLVAGKITRRLIRLKLFMNCCNSREQ